MKYFLLLLLSTTALTLCAKTVSFRSGEIYLAETSTFKPEIKNWHKDHFGVDSAPLYAAVAVKLHPQRKISIFDYVLEFKGMRHNCVAIRVGNGDFTYTKEAIPAQKDTIYTLFFFIQGASSSENQTATLISLFPPKSISTPRFAIPHRPSGPPCPYNFIFKDGNF